MKTDFNGVFQISIGNTEGTSIRKLYELGGVSELKNYGIRLVFISEVLY